MQSTPKSTIGYMYAVLLSKKLTWIKTNDTKAITKK
jgi:hypothetical protein